MSGNSNRQVDDIKKFLDIVSNDFDEKWAARAGAASGWLEMLYMGWASVDDLRNKVRDVLRHAPKRPQNRL